MEIDRISFLLGMMNCFAEMVAAGVKTLALSPPLTPGDYAEVGWASAKMVDSFGIQSYLEQSLLITALQSEDFTRGKWSILYFKASDVLDRYFELKARQEKLRSENRYDNVQHRDISARFMRLLSYPEEVIEAKLAGRSRDPFMLIDI